MLKFRGVDSISQAEALTGCEIQLPREERLPLAAGEHAKEGGELRDGELFRAGRRRKIERPQDFAYFFRFAKRAQVVYQCFALLRKAQFHEIEETVR